MTPVAAFFQPARNVPLLASWGVTHFFGPEVENAKGLAPGDLARRKDEWVAAVRAAGARCVLKLGAAAPLTFLPDNCAGLLLSADEPNGKGIPASSLKAEADALRAGYPGVPIFLSLAGDKVTNIKPTNRDYAQQVAELQAYVALADVVTVDCYSKNRNADRYPVTWTADAVRIIRSVASTVRVWAWVECNDQQLPPPTTPGQANREPTPTEIADTVVAALTAGAEGIGWFMTADRGQYGWGVKDPAVGDSYLPMVNRRGESMAPQYAALKDIAARLNPAPAPDVPATPAPPVPTGPAVLSVEEFERFKANVVGPLRDQLDAQGKLIGDLQARLAAGGMLIAGKAGQ